MLTDNSSDLNKESGKDVMEAQENQHVEDGEPSSKEKEVNKTSKPTVDSAKSKRNVRLPLSRIKQIMKTDPQVNMASSESVFLIAKCAEAFVEMLTKEAYTYTSSSKKKTVQKRDVDSAISNCDQLIFLEGALDFS